MNELATQTYCVAPPKSEIMDGRAVVITATSRELMNARRHNDEKLPQNRDKCEKAISTESGRVSRETNTDRG